VSYESSEIRSVLVVASPGGQCLLSPKRQSSDIPRDKNLRDFNDCDEKTMLLVHLIIYTVAHSGRFPYLQEENLGQQNHMCTINESQYANSQFLTSVEERFIGGRGKHPHKDVVEVGSQRSLSCSTCMETQCEPSSIFVI
jgi:hypothetical protein